MLHVEVGADGRAIRWATSPFEAASVEAPIGTDFAAVYFKDGEIKPLPPAPAPYLSWDLEAEQWLDKRSPEQIAADLAAARRAAARLVNVAAGAARMRFITDLPGQDMVYKAKLDEARAFLAVEEPASLDAFPLLAAEVGITAPDARQIALIWLFMAEIWTQAAAQIEAARLSGVAAVDVALNLSQIEAAAESARAVLEQITPGAATQEKQA